MKKEEWQAPCPSHECHASHLQDQWGLSLQGLSPKPVHLLPYPMADFTQHYRHSKSVSKKLRYYQSPSHKHTREKSIKLVWQDRVPTCCSKAEFLQICHMRNVVRDCCLHHIYTPSSIGQWKGGLGCGALTFNWFVVRNAFIPWSGAPTGNRKSNSESTCTPQQLPSEIRIQKNSEAVANML